jgi:hypothetical protein
MAMAPRKDVDAVIAAPSDKDKILAIEVKRITRKGMPTSAELAELYKKYPHDEKLVDEILRASTKKYMKILKLARKVAEKVKTKYDTGMRPLHEILEKMTKYKKDNDWTDSQYNIFMNELKRTLSPQQAFEIDYGHEMMMQRSRINRTLGYTMNIQAQIEGRLHIKDSEQGILAEILSMYETSLPLYNSGMMAGLMYEDCALQAMTGEFNRAKHFPSNHIHPIIAAIFLPKFEIFEYHMLYANIGRIIKCRNEGKPIMTEPDALLYYDLVSDPNDVVCDAESPITDLRNRYRVQIKLWTTVQKLRNGMYYEDSPISEFIIALNQCRNNLYDNADLAYNQDEGAIMRRLLSVFSLRPILIKTMPLAIMSGFMGMGGLGMGGLGAGMAGSSMMFNNQPVATITSIPMITLQLPFSLSVGNGEVQLEDGLRQSLWVNEHKTIVPKEQSIIYSREVCIFYVNRRVQSIQIKTFVNPLQFAQLPLTLNSTSRINDYPVNAPLNPNIAGEIYDLRSVVAVTDTEIEQSGKHSRIITGNVALIVGASDPSRGIYTDTYYRYDPIGASIPYKAGTGHITNKPVHSIPFMNFGETPNEPIGMGFMNICRSRGTIFIYAKSTGYSRESPIITSL